ncbi:hypothetical protein Tco_0821771 [Tanacetum coccineum]|uniref:Uncharacterized protein n=1 Tax=Tanacetum coccineum TaxID=301880 RepID=A0ABQ5AFU3_9ASTR
MMFTVRSLMRVSTNAPPSSSTSLSSNFEFQQMAVALEDKMTLTFREFDYEVNYRVPLILVRPFLRTARVLINVYREELVTRDGMERIVFKLDGRQDKESIHMMDIYDDRFKDVCEPESNDSSSPTSTIVEEFDSLVGEIIKKKEEDKENVDP